MSVQMEVWGDYACWSRPELKTERYSYDVPTPSGARGMLESVYWHPGLRWHIDKVYVMNPIRFTNLRRNEVKSKILASAILSEANGKAASYIDRNEDIQQRATTMLRDVHYVIEAHFEMTDKASASDNPGKFQDIVKRRIQRGQFYHQPCFGCREFPAQFRWCEEPPPCPEELKGPRDLGWMLYDMDYTNPEDTRPLFFRASLEDGVLRVPGRNSREVRG